MNSVGVDLHKRRSHVAALDEQGRKILSRRIEIDPAIFLELLSEIDGESKVALEATYGWEWLADVLERYRAGRRMDFETAGPDEIATAIGEEIGRDVDYRPVETDGAATAAAQIAELL